MPFGRPGTLTDEEVYAVTAHLLYLKDLVGDDETIGPGNPPPGGDARPGSIHPR